MQKTNAAIFAKLSPEQIAEILDKLVPLIAAPKDHAVFRFSLGETLAGVSSAEAAAFVQKLLAAKPA